MVGTVTTGDGLIKRDRSGDLIRQGDSTITYSILDSVGPVGQDDFIVRSYDPLIENNPTALRNALWVWSDVADITFVKTSDSANVDLRFGAANLFIGILGIALTENNNDGTIKPGAEIYIDNGQTDLSVGGDGYLTLIHEIGHGIGLDHPVRNEAVDGPFLPASHDNERYTVMSNDGFPRSNEHASAPMMIDIMAVQMLYGANTTTRTGDTTYGFHSNAKFDDSNVLRPDYDFSKNPSPITTIWDAGGNDTLDASGYSTAVDISLLPGTFSSVGNLSNNLGIAEGTTIENAIGGSGNDTIVGNTVANRLDGGRGNDKLQGLGGNDELIGGDGDDELFGDSFRFDEAGAGRDGNDTIRGGAGNDTLFGEGGRDIMTGDSGNDFFVFQSGGGHDTITDFEAGAGSGDVLVLVGFNIARLGELRQFASESGGTTTLDFDASTSIELVGVRISDFAADDFVLM